MAKISKIQAAEFKIFAVEANKGKEYNMNKDEKIINYDRSRTINKMMSRMPGKKSDEDEGRLDSREKLSRSISNRRILEIAADNEAAEAAAALAVEQVQDEEWEARKREEEAEMDEFDNEFSPEAIFQRFTEFDESEEGYEGYSDVWAHHDLRQPIFDALDLAINEQGRNPNDWRIYEEIGNQFRERLQNLKNEPGLSGNYQREDDVNRISVKRIRQHAIDNEYFNSALHKGEPTSNEEIVQKFATDFPDVVQHEQSLVEATSHVDEIQKENYIEQGYPDTGYDVYEQAGEAARTQNALRELAEGRNQDPEDI